MGEAKPELLIERDSCTEGLLILEFDSLWLRLFEFGYVELENIERNCLFVDLGGVFDISFEFVEPEFKFENESDSSVQFYGFNKNQYIYKNNYYKFGDSE